MRRRLLFWFRLLRGRWRIARGYCPWCASREPTRCWCRVCYGWVRGEWHGFCPDRCWEEFRRQVEEELGEGRG